MQDYADQDIPAAIDHVWKNVDTHEIHYVGHSMGAMLYFATSARQPELKAKVGSGTLLAGSVDWPAVSMDENVLDYIDILPNSIPARQIKNIYEMTKDNGYIPDELVAMIANQNNIDRGVLKASEDAFADTSPLVLTQFIDWYVRHDLGDNQVLDHQMDQLKEKGLLAPTRMINGADDQLVDISRVREGVGELQSDELELIVASPENGFEYPYNHIDVVYGRAIHDEITPRIAENIERNPLPELRPTRKTKARNKQQT